MTRVYEVEGGFVISENGTWLPGIFADPITAEAAADLDHAVLAGLNDRICNVNGEDRPITAADLATVPTHSISTGTKR